MKPLQANNSKKYQDIILSINRVRTWFAIAKSLARLHRDRNILSERYVFGKEELIFSQLQQKYQYL